jgi:hypothetical protein
VVNAALKYLLCVLFQTVTKLTGCPVNNFERLLHASAVAVCGRRGFRLGGRSGVGGFSAAAEPKGFGQCRLPRQIARSNDRKITRFIRMLPIIARGVDNLKVGLSVGSA